MPASRIGEVGKVRDTHVKHLVFAGNNSLKIGKVTTFQSLLLNNRRHQVLSITGHGQIVHLSHVI